MTKELKLAIIEPVGGHGGMDYYDFSLAQALTDVGIEVYLYSCDETFVPDKLGFKVNLAFKAIYGTDPKVLRAWRYLKGLLFSFLDAKRKGVTVVHFHLFQSAALELLASVLAKCFGFNLVWTIHDVEAFAGDSSKAILKQVFRLTNQVIVHNAISERVLQKNLTLHSSKVKKINVIPHGNYVASAKPLNKIEARRKLGVPLNKHILLFFGQIKQVKGLDVLLEAFALAVKQDDNLHLIIAGKVWKDDFSIYQKLIRTHNLEDYLTLNIRYISNSDVASYYNAADLIVLPYREIYQSGVLLMAMSYARAVLVSDLAGMREVVTPSQGEVYGFVFEPGNVDALSKLLLELSQDVDRLGDMARQSFDYVSTKYAWEAIARKTKEVYEQV